MRTKKKQRIVGALHSLNNPPSWRLSKGKKREYESDVAESSSSAAKRPKFGQERDIVLLNALNHEFYDMLSGDIIQCIESKGDLEALKLASTSTLRLRKGTVTRAERRINASATELENLLKRKRKDKTPYQRWKEFVDQNFDSIAQKIQSNLKGKGKDPEVQHTEITSSEAHTEDDPIPLTNEETELRTFSCSLTPLFRSDLAPDIQNEFLDNIRSAMISATDYIYEYGIQMFKSVLLFKNATFAATEDVTITLEQKNGVLISDMLPQSYQPQYTTTYCPPPLNRDLLSSNSYAQNLVQLFNFNQLQLVYSMYFGPKGVQHSTQKPAKFMLMHFKNFDTFFFSKQETRSGLPSMTCNTFYRVRCHTLIHK